MGRVVQFFLALAAAKGLSGDEVQWVRRRLAPPEIELFSRMAAMDQKHAVRVARKAVALARRRGVSAEAELRTLERAALLHDIGKRAGDIGLWDRVVIVLARRFAPKLARSLAERGKGDFERDEETGSRGAGSCRAGLFRAFYAQATHAQRGAEMAREAGVEEAVVALIRRHHEAGRGDLLLELLQEADR